MRVVSENLANAQSTGKTPGADPYTRKTITFENEVDEAARRQPGEGRRASSGTARPIASSTTPAIPPPTPTATSSCPTSTCMVEMADMREANRSYEANLQVIKQAREMISMTIDMLRSI